MPPPLKGEPGGKGGKGGKESENSSGYRGRSGSLVSIATDPRLGPIAAAKRFVNRIPLGMG